MEIRARGERPLVGPRNGECALSLACYHPSGMRARGCLDSPVYEPGEEHATAQVLNANAWTRLVNAGRARGCGELCGQLVQVDSNGSSAESRRKA